MELTQLTIDAIREGLAGRKFSAEELVRATGLPLSEARNHFEAQASQDGVVEASGQLRTVAVSLFKIANDIITLVFR